MATTGRAQPVIRVSPPQLQVLSAAVHKIQYKICIFQFSQLKQVGERSEMKVCACKLKDNNYNKQKHIYMCIFQDRSIIKFILYQYSHVVGFACVRNRRCCTTSAHYAGTTRSLGESEFQYLQKNYAKKANFMANTLLRVGVRLGAMRHAT